ncbi:jupiter microtubule associated homolog 2 isoform X2 [Archocentrus centrarchus]|uniref:jupiter microtubule associated homolog 2 isoform X2 n=1 Tax=Archocentrus centrarchus TaxID=63155 RepID=UPI0011E9C6A2|nr:jupiter microtubule associated homolog 2 isoform X2 [Archocentrus centrarchus]
MTSTNMFQGLDTGSKPSSRVLQPPGGGSSNLFGGYEEDSAASRRPNKMASKVFAPPEEPQSAPRRTNPPGGPGSNIFGPADTTPVQSPSRSYPNKPKDNLSVGPEPESPAKASQPEAKEETAPPAAPPAKEEPPAAAAVSAPSQPECTPSSFPDETLLKNHEPHLGPKPRSHNRVLNPPGGKSSVVFY